MSIKFVICWTLVLNIILHVSIIKSRLAEPTEEPIPIYATEAITTPSPPAIDLHCFHQSEEKCPPSNSTCKCQALPENPKAVICCNIYSFLEENNGCPAVDGRGNVQALHIRNASFDSLSITSKWKRLKSLSITDGKITKISGMFQKYASIECLNLSNNGISEINPRAVVNLHNLSTLDLSYNNIEILDKLGITSRKAVLNISHNAPLQCDSLLTTLKNITNIMFQHQNETFCLSSTSFHWFNTTVRVPFTQIEAIYKLNNECPTVEKSKQCDCKPYRIDIVEGKPPTFSVQVDCSNRNLSKLPEILPPNTILLNVSFNNIKSLTNLRNDTYNSIKLLFAEHNQITSIEDMEGSSFIHHFVELNLRHNKLDSIPMYMLINSLDRNSNQQNLRLGQNKLTCNCGTVNGVKIWLMTVNKIIPDYDEIYCNNLPGLVIELDQSVVCQYPKDLTDYINYIIALEVFLFVGLIVKVSYDYWIFKTTGYLPWPASKIPKLPCDWLCET